MAENDCICTVFTECPHCPELDIEDLNKKIYDNNKAFVKALETHGYLSSLLNCFVAISFIRTNDKGEDNFNYKPVNFIVQLPSDDQRQLWCLDLTFFEPLHGLSRLLRLIPDKLATALQIKRVARSNDGEDTDFLFNLLIDLFDRYINITTKKYKIFQYSEPESPDVDRHMIVLSYQTSDYYISDLIPITYNEDTEFPDEAIQVKNFLTLQIDLKDQLIELKEVLKTETSGIYKSKSRRLLQHCDNILRQLHIFLNFTHPVMVDINRNRTIDNDSILRIKNNLQNRSARNFLCDEFNSIIDEDDVY